MNTAIWIVQLMLAFAFAFSGLNNVIQPYRRLIRQPQMAWAADFSPRFVKLIGFAETLAALGLTAPGLTHILLGMIPLAATGLAILMLGAVQTHYRRSETGMIGVNLVLFAMAVFVAYGRFVLAPL